MDTTQSRNPAVLDMTRTGKVLPFHKGLRENGFGGSFGPLRQEVGQALMGGGWGGNE